jgi:hypothetical protein
VPEQFFHSNFSFTGGAGKIPGRLDERIKIPGRPGNDFKESDLPAARAAARSGKA